jgi:glycosyltransferase involved in cell wall biosynthesis
VSRLLMLLPSAPWPQDAGAKIRNAGLLHLLREEHEVDVLTFGQVQASCRGVEVLPSPPARSLAQRLGDVARSDLPDMACRLWSSEFAAKLRYSTYDAFQAEGIEMARYLAYTTSDRRVYDAHNAEFLLQQRLSQSGSAVARLYSRLQWRRLERFERAVVRGARMTLAVSAHDANQLLALSGGAANVHALRNAIDVASYPFHPPTAETQTNLLFVGKLDFRPNTEALAWFVPEVVQKLEAARLFAVGAAPPVWLVRAGQHDQRVAVTGYVADERPYFSRSAALVLPVRTAGGSRLKALVAMASGLPIVSTRLGMEGLEAEAGTHFLQAEAADEWIEALRRLLSDAALRMRLACSARELVEARYDWSALREPLHTAYAWL